MSRLSPQERERRMPHAARKRFCDQHLIGHALQRMQQRHSPDATAGELRVLAARAGSVHNDHAAGMRRSDGRVVAVESPSSSVVALPWRLPDYWVRVVYNPQTGGLRTVLPGTHGEEHE